MEIIERTFVIKVNGRRIDHFLQFDADMIEVAVRLSYTGVNAIPAPEVFVFERNRGYYGWMTCHLKKTGDGIWIFAQRVLRDDVAQPRIYDFFFTHPYVRKTRHIAVEIVGRV